MLLIRPFFPRDLTSRFLQATKGKEKAIALASTNGRIHPVFGLWPVELADHLEDQLHSGMRKVLEWAQLHEMIEVPFENKSSDQHDVDPFFNINRPEDLAKRPSRLRRNIYEESIISLKECQQLDKQTKTEIEAAAYRGLVDAFAQANGRPKY